MILAAHEIQHVAALHVERQVARGAAAVQRERADLRQRAQVVGFEPGALGLRAGHAGTGRRGDLQLAVAQPVGARVAVAAGKAADPVLLALREKGQEDRLAVVAVGNDPVAAIGLGPAHQLPGRLGEGIGAGGGVGGRGAFGLRLAGVAGAAGQDGAQCRNQAGARERADRHEGGLRAYLTTVTVTARAPHSAPFARPLGKQAIRGGTGAAWRPRTGASRVQGCFEIYIHK
ncbi:Uncharacterised protein [Bordetella pertussis]|nr:Uncharacterised protein [Bordetella pertussis]